jgi:hypothetical protein
MGGFPQSDEEVSSAEDFIKRLLDRPQGISEPDFRSPWVYRGHGDANWELKPPAWRPDGRQKLKPVLDYFRPKFTSIYNQGEGNLNRVETYRESEIGRCTQIVAEVFAVYQFCQLADELGLSIPGGEIILELELEDLVGRVFSGYQSMPQISSTITSTITELFPPPPFAFAQHHGIPTRFLDWTRDPLVAAWFAADSACNNSEGKICVWATNSKVKPPNTQWVTVPRHAHSYLHAQHGIFSLTGGDFTETVGQQDVWPTFNDCGNEAHRLSLPQSEVPKLLRLLYEKRISKAHLMPTFDSVGATVQSLWRWLPSSPKL